MRGLAVNDQNQPRFGRFEISYRSGAGASAPPSPSPIREPLPPSTHRQRTTHPPRERQSPTLLYALRKYLNLAGTQKGCDHGRCGAFTLRLGGRSAVLSDACRDHWQATHPRPTYIPTAIAGQLQRVLIRELIAKNSTPGLCHGHKMRFEDVLSLFFTKVLYRARKRRNSDDAYFQAFAQAISSGRTREARIEMR